MVSVQVHTFPPSPPSSEKSFTKQTTLVADIPLPPYSVEPEVLELDKKTPDKHVGRDARLIRLTGVHPFNVEAPLTALFNEGFLTSPDLFYVRNHGAVPEVKEEDIPEWTLSIEGMVENPFTLTLRELIDDYEQLTYPITLVCAGNRRKEQNVVRKSKGFSWGPAGVSTALWTGVAMSEVIKRAKPLRKARYVCMEGADRLPNGFYGTCAKLNWVMDPNRGIMLAHRMNGEPLRPDHGKPLRAVIPGQIGGRSVKWLTKLILTEGPSDNWYHLYDNRVLPTMIDPEESAKNDSWWKDERYAIYDLSTNSATAFPEHDERLSISKSAETYSVRGYAYSGGGRRVTRVELSVDQGRTWRLTDIEYPEDKYRDVDLDLYGGKIDMSWREHSFCWCFWSLRVSVSDLAQAKDILVRAMDDSMNVQPRDMYWSVLGMMNNPWFRITITKKEDTLHFEHPTQPALLPGGWMERVKKAGGDLTNGRWGELDEGKKPGKIETAAPKEINLKKAGIDRKITIDELKAHEDEKNPWFVLNGEVYDGTAFLEGHPGGAQSILSAAAMDATDEFMAIHSETAKAMMPDYHIGTLNEQAREILAGGDDKADDHTPREIFLLPKAWATATLSAKKQTSWDTRVFTFKLQHEDQDLGLPTGQHLMIRLRDPVTREAIIRSYTPISETTQKGYVDILIKIYFDSGDVKGGKMTQALDAIPIGHSIEFKGPIGKFEYLGRGRYTLNGKEKMTKKFLMICGGSGVTPIFQIFRAVMRDEQDTTKCVVLNGNRLEEDILCKSDLDALAVTGRGRGNIVYTLTKGTDSWTGLRGRVCGSMVQEYCPRSSEIVVLICGPEPMEKSIHTALKADGWEDDQIVFF